MVMIHCDKHPRYKAMRPPTAVCARCKLMYNAKHGGSIKLIFDKVTKQSVPIVYPPPRRKP